MCVSEDLFEVPEFVYPKDHIPDYSGILVPNVDNIRTDFLIQVIAKQEKGVLLIGESQFYLISKKRIFYWFDFHRNVNDDIYKNMSSLNFKFLVESQAIRSCCSRIFI